MEEMTLERFAKELKAKQSEMKEKLKMYQTGGKATEPIDTAGRSSSEIEGMNTQSENTRKQITKLNTKLKKIAVFLRKIADGEEFGHCHECGQFIGYKRLLHDVTIDECISCASKKDKYQRALRGHQQNFRPKI